MNGIFIRAPAIISHGPDVQVLATLQRGEQTTIVAARQGRILVAAFHVSDAQVELWYFLTFICLSRNWEATLDYMSFSLISSETQRKRDHDFQSICINFKNKTKGINTERRVNRNTCCSLYMLGQS